MGLLPNTASERARARCEVARDALLEVRRAVLVQLESLCTTLALVRRGPVSVDYKVLFFMFQGRNPISLVWEMNMPASAVIYLHNNFNRT